MSEIRVTIPDWLIIFFAAVFVAGRIERWIKSRKENKNVRK